MKCFTLFDNTSGSHSSSIHNYDNYDNITLHPTLDWSLTTTSELRSHAELDFDSSIDTKSIPSHTHATRNHHMHQHLGDVPRLGLHERWVAAQVMWTKALPHLAAALFLPSFSIFTFLLFLHKSNNTHAHTKQVPLPGKVCR